MKRAKTSISTVAAAFRNRGRSKLYSWLWEHFDELPPYEKYRVNWPEMASALTALGITGRQDKPLTPDIVRKTYERVSTDRKAIPPTADTTAARPPLSASPPPSVTAAPARALPAASPPKEQTPYEPGQPRAFKLDLSPKEDDKERLFGKHVVRKGD